MASDAREQALRELWAADLGMPADEFDANLSRATAFRGLIEALDEAGHRQTIEADVPEPVVEYMRPLVQGSLRLFGAHPHGLLRRVPAVMESQIKGTDFTYEKISPTRAIITVRQRAPLPQAHEWVTNIYWEEVLLTSVDLCGKHKGAVHTTTTQEPDMAITTVDMAWHD